VYLWKYYSRPHGRTHGYTVWGYIGITMSGRLATFLVSDNIPKRRNWYWWNFTL